jgi:UDP-N-acetylmuramoyl-tripeptide--D-alanyl-D-alanine ligase
MPGDLFVALPGTASDGHKFLPAALAAGASAALVTQIDGAVALPQICVSDCLQALRQLALVGRQRFQGIKFGITGSVGKTGSKDMLWHALSQLGSCHASKRSFNNHIGVPVTLASLPEHADFAVQEMGMNAAGEIASLTRLTRPQIAFITRIADTHREFFTSTADIAAAKAEIFQGLEGLSTAILNHDDAFFENLRMAAIQAGAKKVISFGRHPEADYRLLSIDHHDAGMMIHASLAGSPCIFALRMYGSHLAENAMGVLACVAAAGLPADKAAAALVDCLLPTGRGQRSSGIYHNHSISIIDDSYNASPASMNAAFASLANTPPQIMVLSEMRELGEATAAAHAALAPHINKLAPRLVITIGAAMHDMLDGLDQSISGYAAADISAAIAHLTQSICDGDRIFIKGSNGSGAWRVRDALCAAITPDAPQNTLKGASHAA